MAEAAVALLTLLSVLQCRAHLGVATPCLNPHDTFVKLALQSRRNQTGHWSAQLELEHGSDNLEANPWEIDIQHSTVTCHGKESVKITAIVTAPPQTSQFADYEFEPGLGYYKFHTELRTWDQARLACQQEGAHLAVINSESESAALRRIYEGHPDVRDCAFLGFHDLFAEGVYTTVHGESLNATGFTRWSPQQPDNFGDNPGEDCGSLHRETGGLNDLSCNLHSPFFCEKNL